MQGSTPLDVAAASCIDNNELALALQEQDLEMVHFSQCSKSSIVQILSSSEYDVFPGGEVFGWVWTSELPNAIV